MIYFFQMMMLLLVYVATLSQQLHFRRIYFFTVNTSSEQLDIKSNQLDIKITFSKQLFLQSCYFFGTAPFSDLSVLLSSFFFSEQLRFQSETFTEHLTIENRQSLRTAIFFGERTCSSLFRAGMSHMSSNILIFIVCRSFYSKLLRIGRYVLLLWIYV